MNAAGNGSSRRLFPFQILPVFLSSCPLVNGSRYKTIHNGTSTGGAPMNPRQGPSPGRRLRDAWAAGAIAVPGVFNALVGRMAERLGFKAVYLSGAALSASAGLP